MTGLDLDAIRARDARYPAGPITNDVGSPIMAAQDRRALLAEVDRLRAREERVRAEVLREVCRHLDLDSGTVAGCWIQVFVGGDPYDETAADLWRRAWAFAHEVNPPVDALDGAQPEETGQ